MSRTTVDWSKHQVIKTETPELLVYYFKKPDTTCQAIKFINIKGEGLVVTGDYGSWMFCREFHPSAKGSVSDQYWSEKLRIGSTQDPYVFDSEVAQAEIKDILAEDERDYHHSLSDEEKEWLNELSDEADQGEYSFIAKAMEHPSSFETESIPHGKTLNQWLLIVFDAFEEICRRIAAESPTT
jgi:hypothetical protein